MDEKLQNLQEQLKSYQAPQSGQQPATSSDIRNQQAGLKTAAELQNLISKKRAEDWYPDKQVDTGKSGGEAVPVFNKIIDAAQTPLFGIVGAIDYATGKSGGKSLGESINYNANTAKRTFGDVTGNPVAGLALDIMFDPLNWATAGTAALIPRTAVGLTKGTVKGGIKEGLRGAGSAIESRVLETTLTTGALAKGTVGLTAKATTYLNPMRYVNKLSGKPVADGAKLSAATKSKFVDFLEGRSVKATNTYDEVVGSDAIQRMVADKTPVGLIWRKGIQDLATRAIAKAPMLSDYFDKYWKYSNSDWARVSQIRDALLKTVGEEMDTGLKAYVRSKETGEDFEEALTQITKTYGQKVRDIDDIPNIPEDPFSAADSLPKKTLEERQKVLSSYASEVGDETKVNSLREFLDESDIAEEIGKNPSGYVTSDHVENGLRLAEEKGLIDRTNMPAVMQDLQTLIKRGDAGETGVRWWDNMRTNLRTFELKVNEANKAGTKATLKNRVGSKAAAVLDVYEMMTSLFKRGAVGASPTAWTNALFGNLVMAKMAGLDVADPKFYKSFASADTVLGAKSGADLLLAELVDSAELLPLLRNNPTAFEEATSLSPAQFTRYQKAKDLVKSVKQKGTDAGIFTAKTTDAEVISTMEGMLDDAADTLKTESSADMLVNAHERASLLKMTESSYDRTLASLDENGRAQLTAATDFVSNELFDSTRANKLYAKWANAAKEEGNYGAKLGNLLFNTMPSEYGKLDYRFKLGSLFYTTVEGVKEGELRILGRLVNLNQEDVVKVVKDGVTRYRISAPKALQIANEAYLNYAAMPAMVKLIRQLPLVGAPFAAFTYGMTTKTLRTALTNPAFFNKANYAMNEFSAEETPIEKGLLGMDRYSYLDDPAMIHLPFFKNNMVFMNLANMIPYYSLNMFQPSQRTYQDTLSNSVIQTLDRLPIMKDPAGQVIFDYFLLPHLIGDELPQGSFGQTLYPKDATLAEKIKYAARSAADPYVPGIAQPVLGLAAGLAENAGVLPEGAVQNIPGYRLRSVGEAVQGNTSVGVESKEPATQRTLRNLGAALGVSIQTPVPYSYLDEEEYLGNNNQ